MTLSLHVCYYKNYCIFPVNCTFYLNSSLNGTTTRWTTPSHLYLNKFARECRRKNMASSPSHFCCNFFELNCNTGYSVKLFSWLHLQKNIQTSARHMFDDICTHKYYVICLILVKTFNSLHCFAKLRLLLPLELLLWLLPVLLGCWAGVEFCSLHFLLFALLSRLFLCAILNLFIANFFAYSFANVFVAVISVFCCISGCKLNS